MGLLSTLGRFLFASHFIISAWLTLKELQSDPVLLEKEYAAKMAGPLDLMVHMVHMVHFSDEKKAISVYFFISLFMILKTIGGFLFIFGRLFSFFCLYLYFLMAIPTLCGFYHYKVGEPQFNVLLQDFVQTVSLFGALLLYTVMKLRLRLIEQQKKFPGLERRINLMRIEKKEKGPRYKTT